MDIVINIEPIMQFLSLPADQILLRLFYYIGWIPVAIVFIWGVAQTWLMYVRLAYGASEKTIILAIDAPRGNAQTPMAVENIFSYLAGAHSSKDLFEKWWLSPVGFTKNIYRSILIAGGKLFGIPIKL